MNTMNRRHDDYRPAWLRRFWQGAQKAIWKLQDAAIAWFDIVHFVVFCAFVVGLLLLSLYLLSYLRFG